MGDYLLGRTLAVSFRFTEQIRINPIKHFFSVDHIHI